MAHRSIKWKRSLRKKFAWLKTKHKSEIQDLNTINLGSHPSIRLYRFRRDASDFEDHAEWLDESISKAHDEPREPPSTQNSCSESQVSQTSSKTYVASQAPSFVGGGDCSRSLDIPVLGPTFGDEHFPSWMLASKPKHFTPPPFQSGSLDVYVAHTNTPGNIYSILHDYYFDSSHWEPTEPIFVDNSHVSELEIPSIGDLQSGDIISGRPRSSSTSTTTTSDSYITAASYLDSEDESDIGANIRPDTPNTSLFGSPDSNTTLASSISSQSWTTTPTLTSLPDRYNLNYPLRKDILFPAESPIFNMLLPAEQSLKYLTRALSLAQQSFFDFCKIHFPGLVEYKSQSLWDFQNSIGFPDGPSLIQWTKEKMGDYLNNLDGEKMNTTKPSGAIKRLLDYPHLVSLGIWPSELQDALVQATDVRNAVCHPMAQELCNPENVDDLLRKAQKAVALMDPDSVRAMELSGMRMSMKRDLEREWEFTKGFFGHMKENGGEDPPELEVHQRRCLDMMRRDLFERAKRNYEGFSKWTALALETNHIEKFRFISV